MALLDSSRCRFIKTSEGLRFGCDLMKDASGRGHCKHRPRTTCHLKRHTEVLKRYGHFGKVPTSLALVLREAGVDDLADLHRQVLEDVPTPVERAAVFEQVLSRAWRVSDKISAMFLSAISNPDLSDGLTPWGEGVDWTRFVVIDSNVDSFLELAGFPGPWSYDARRRFIIKLSKRIDLSEYNPRLHRYNPRIVQQALYLFMSKTNRSAKEEDCAHRAPLSCGQCNKDLRTLCPLVG